MRPSLTKPIHICFDSHVHGILIHHSLKLSLKAVDSRVDLISSGVHNRANQAGSAKQVVCRRVKCRNMDQRFI